MSLPIADHWFERLSFGDGVTLLWEPHVHPLLRCNIWHVAGRDSDLLIDTGLGVASLAEAAWDLFDKPLSVILTHGHMDHAGGAHEFPTCHAHPAEARAIAEASNNLPLAASAYSEADHAWFRYIGEGDCVDTGDRSLEVLHLPGHSPGSIALWEQNTGTLFSGDAIYDGPPLDQIPGSDIPAYLETMRRLRNLPVSVVHAGHDPSFGRERLIEIADPYLISRSHHDH